MAGVGIIPTEQLIDASIGIAKGTSTLPQMRSITSAIYLCFLASWRTLRVYLLLGHIVQSEKHVDLWEEPIYCSLSKSVEPETVVGLENRQCVARSL